MLGTRTAIIAALAVIASSAPAYADITISTAATQNMSCSGGVCAPTATDAVLNVTDLESFLASGNIEVTTTGSGVQANAIDVVAAVSWSASSTLGLDAYRAIILSAPVASEGNGGMSLQGGLVFTGGNITFAELSSNLTIDGRTYVLADSIASLAAAIAAAPTGRFALANNYDASGDGTYTSNPIPTIFNGMFEGLGNTISNLTIDDPTASEEGLFYEVGRGGAVRNIALANASITASGGRFASSGTIVGVVYGSLSGCSANGSVTAEDYGGGLVAANVGIITNSYSTAAVQAGFVGGGLAGSNSGKIRASYASGAVTGVSYAGGLIGVAQYGGIVEFSHASGSVIVSGEYGEAGGLAADNGGWLLYTYATGSVTAEQGAYEGGLVGIDLGDAKISRSFATGNVVGAAKSTVSGFVGAELGATDNSYATGAVSAGDQGQLGGFVGCTGDCDENSGGNIRYSYSSGRVRRSKGGYVGGFAGMDETSNGINGSYWDTSTSGRRRGTGNRGNEPGLGGRTTAQLKSALPKGFSSKIWAEDSNINNGLPYLIHNPPPT